MAPRRCLHPGCTRYTQGNPRCPQHAAGPGLTNNDRGYGPAHRRTRAQTKVIVDQGHATCARCGQPIEPGTPWHLDHDDTDRTKYIGPSHAHCNIAAAG